MISPAGQRMVRPHSDRLFSISMEAFSEPPTTEETGSATPAAILRPAVSYSNSRAAPPAVGARLSSTAFREEPTQPGRHLGSSPTQPGTSTGQPSLVAEQRDQTGARMGPARARNSRPRAMVAGRKRLFIAFKAGLMERSQSATSSAPHWGIFFAGPSKQA